jgi:ribosomal protein S18 acetylase RimI-like enzyme
MKDISIRQISPEDLPQLKTITSKTFMETYAAGNTEEDMQQYLRTNFSAEILEAEVKNKNSRWFFAEEEGRVIGYLKVNFSAAQTEIHDAASLEIERIYVYQEYQGKKIGQLLYQTALTLAQEKKLDYLWLGVWDQNTKALEFYQKNGFVPFGNHVFTLGQDKQNDILMKKMI